MSENGIADVTNIEAMRPRKSGYAIFQLKTGENCQTNTNTGYSVYSEQTVILCIPSILLSEMDGLLFRLFRNQNRSQKNTITVNSVYSNSGIVP